MMKPADVRAAYGRMASAYVEALGSTAQMAEEDFRFIERWVDRVAPGPVIDAGCGPGHWTAWIHECGVAVTGIDAVSEFIDSARLRFPGVSFREGDLTDLDFDTGSQRGLLAWYSLIHCDPEELPETLDEFARVLAPGGELCLGFFEGPSREPFEHAITTAFYWSVPDMTSLLECAGFTVTGVEQRHDRGSRPHAALIAFAR